MPADNGPTRRIIVVFRNDDPSALSDVTQERTLFERFEFWNIPQTIGVVPKITRGDQMRHGKSGYAPLSENPQMVHLLVDHCRKTRSEVAQHGLTHQTNRLSIPSRRFFFEMARLSFAEQEAMLQEGLELLAQSTGLTPQTFIPPWNRYDENTVEACRATGFKVISTRFFSRVAGGIIGFGCNSSLPEFAEHLEQARRAERRVFIHVLLHTPSMRKQDDLRQLEEVLRAVCAEPECEPVTISTAAERYSEHLREYNHAGHAVIAFHEEMNSRRARAHNIARIAERIGCPPGLRRARHRARVSYRRGEYATCIALDAEIEQSTTRLLYLSRVVASILGFVLAPLYSVAVAGWSPPVTAVIGGTAAVAVLGMAAIRRATSPDTRREAALLSSLLGAGWLAGCLI
jgi:predicted deacetylase